MLINTLNEYIVEMNTVYEMEITSVDTKKQAIADRNFKQLVVRFSQTICEVDLAIKNSGFSPSSNVISKLKEVLELCDKLIQAGITNNTSTNNMNSQIDSIYSLLAQEWMDYYTKLTSNIFSLLDTLKGILPDVDKAQFAINKIKKAANWNKTVDDFDYLKKGMVEAEQILAELDMDEASDVLAFFELVNTGKATILDLTDEILAWIKAENLGEKLLIHFKSFS